jgi:hypothetical protein
MQASALPEFFANSLLFYSISQYLTIKDVLTLVTVSK